MHTSNPSSTAPYYAGAVQFLSRLGDKAYNVSHMEALMRSAKQGQPALRLLVFPELCTTGYECGADFFTLAEPVQGETLARISALCRELACSMVYGFAERGEDGLLYNSAAFVADTGALCGVYRKVHLFDTERDVFAPGSSLPVFDTPLGRVGVMVCWDLAFPEHARSLALQGASLLVSSSAWEAPYARNYRLACQVRAYENCITHIAANRAGQEPSNRFIGHSGIYAAGGEAQSVANHEEEAVILAEINPEQDCLRRVEEYAFFQNRRPELYHK